MLRCRCLRRARGDDYPLVPVALTVGAAVGLAVYLRTRPKPAGYRMTLEWRAYDALAQALDDRYGWDKLPKVVSLGVLIGLRNLLRQHNLYDTGTEPTVNRPQAPPPPADYLTSRTAGGSYNDLGDPTMGMSGMRFGRNMPLAKTMPDRARLLEPNPRVVSRELLTRETFTPATSVNSLAATWLQFMVKDWFSHGTGTKDNPYQLAPVAGDDWPTPPVTIMRTLPDPTTPPGSGAPPTYLNTETPWWDGSQIYGSNADLQKLMRTGQDGKLVSGPGGIVPLPGGDQSPDMTPGFWLGIAAMRNLFALEHNAICDRLKQAYPSWSDDALFQRARLVNAALIAKIHTVEWTPAIISHPVTQYALPVNWYGIAGPRVHRMLGRLGNSEVLSGIPGSPTDHYGVPYSITEEFAAVYRMHPLIRDDYDFRNAIGDAAIQSCTFAELTGPAGQAMLEKIGLRDALYSFGTLYPGAIILHNYPRFLQQFTRPKGDLQDLAATDILRSRELGVPRYNEFRRLLRLRPAQRFGDLCLDPRWGEELRQVYDGDLEAVDLSVGLFAEQRPTGFAFSDTAFRIFILMASRRLNSDRFFTVDFTPKVYTPEGLQWIDDNSMSTVLTRHFPELGGSLRSIANAFTPWPGTR
jgi:hypothetical protein